MKILIVNSFYFPEIKGGAEYSVKKLAEQLVHNGHSIKIIAAGHIDSNEIIDGVYVSRRKFNSIYHSYNYTEKNFAIKIIHRLLDFNNFFNIKILQKEIQEFKPDIIPTNNLYEITPVIWKIAHSNNIPVIHTIRDYYLLCPKTTLLKKGNIHCSNPPIFCKAYQSINRYISGYVDYLTAPSNMMLEMTSDFCFFQKAHKYTIYNAAEFNIDKVKNIINNKKEKGFITYIYVGGLYPHKGIRNLIESFELINDKKVRLLIAGMGDELEYVKEAEKKDARIVYKGFLKENELEEILIESDVLVCPSLWNEPFGRVILDAYKNGLPVIGNKIGALPELIDHNKTGLLVEANNTEKLRQAMEYILFNKEILNKYRKNIPKKLSEFSIEVQRLKFEEIYNRAIKEKLIRYENKQ